MLPSQDQENDRGDRQNREKQQDRCEQHRAIIAHLYLPRFGMGNFMPRISDNRYTASPRATRMASLGSAPELREIATIAKKRSFGSRPQSGHVASFDRLPLCIGLQEVSVGELLPASYVATHIWSYCWTGVTSIAMAVVRTKNNANAMRCHHEMPSLRKPRSILSKGTQMSPDSKKALPKANLPSISHAIP